MKLNQKYWNKVAESQFKHLPKEFKDDWRDLRKTVYGQ